MVKGDINKWYKLIQKKYVPIVEATAKENGIPFKAIHICTKEEAQNAPTPITTYALFKDGKYITNEQMNDSKFLKMVKSLD